MMVANITYAYTIEIGPTEKELDDLFLEETGFSVYEENIQSIVERAYAGIYQYLKSFLDKLVKKVELEIEKKCSRDYDVLMRTFRGYWSKNKLYDFV
jgi:hypothetical protein